MNFIILGDKFQKRMKSKGCVGLIKIKNKPIIDHQYSIIKKFFPSAKIIYVAGFEYKKISSFLDKNDNYKDIILLNNKNYEKYNNVHSLSLAENYLDDECFIMFGDKILTKPILKKFDTNNGCQIFIDNSKKESLGCIIQKSIIETISYDINNYLLDMYYISAPCAQKIKSLIQTQKYNNFFIFEIINKLINSNTIFKPFYVGES
jgi:choline kinase